MENTKQAILVSNDPQILGIEFHGVSKSPVRMSEVK